MGRGESNRPAEDSGGRRSKLYRDLSWGCLPPTTLHYRQLVPEGQPRALASKPEDQAHQLISQHPSSVRTRAVERTATRYPTYGSAAEVKGAFISDLRSEVGQKLAALLKMLDLPRFEDIEAKFMSLCREMGV